MSDSTRQPNKDTQADEIRAMIQADFERISQTRDPYRTLNLAPSADIGQVRARYERYEKFYRVDNFHRFNDPDLTRRALDIRRALSQAMVAINARQNTTSDVGRSWQNLPGISIPQPDQDCVPLGDIYFRDGLTYLKLRDLNSAEDCLQRAVDHDPSRGILVAYLSYARFKLRNNDPVVVEECRKNMRRAADMDPDNAEIFVLLTRFAINVEDLELGKEAISRVGELRAEHPKLARLHARLSKLSTALN